MKIKNVKTVEEYKKVRDKKIQKWIDDRFVENSVEWKLISSSIVEIMDKTGKTMQISIYDMED